MDWRGSRVGSLRGALILAVFTMVVAMAGCAGTPAGPEDEQGKETVRPDAQWMQTDLLAEAGFQTTSIAVSSLPIEVPENTTDLLIAIAFGPSAFVEFNFGGIDSCEDLGLASGVFTNSSTWSGACGATAAGTQTLTWNIAAGRAQGRITVAANHLVLQA